jgi:hypothetical protein
MKHLHIGSIYYFCMYGFHGILTEESKQLQGTSDSRVRDGFAGAGGVMFFDMNQW